MAFVNKKVINLNNAGKIADQNTSYTASVSDNATNEGTSNSYDDNEAIRNSHSVCKTNGNSFNNPQTTFSSFYPTSTPSNRFEWQNDNSTNDKNKCSRRNTRKRSYNEPSFITTRQGSKRNIREVESYIWPITQQRKIVNKIDNGKINDLIDLNKKDSDLFAFLLQNDPSWSGLYEYPIDLSNREINLCPKKNVDGPLKGNNLDEIEAIKNEAKKVEAKINFMKMTGLDVSESGKEEIEKKMLELHKKIWVLKHT